MATLTFAAVWGGVKKVKPLARAALVDLQEAKKKKLETSLLEWSDPI